MLLGTLVALPVTSLAFGSNVTLSVTVKNTDPFKQTPTVSATSSNSSVVTVTADGANPTTIAAGASAVYTLTVEAAATACNSVSLTCGSADIGVEISG